MNRKTSKQKKEEGITLVALVVTIVILLILAGITISLFFGENSIFSRAQEAKFKARWSTYKEQTDTYTTWKIASTMNIEIKGINAGETLKELIEIEADVDIKEADINTQMSDIVNNLEKQDEPYAVVYHGELCYVLDDHNKNGQREARMVLTDRNTSIRIKKTIRCE